MRESLLFPLICNQPAAVQPNEKGLLVRICENDRSPHCISSLDSRVHTQQEAPTERTQIRPHRMRTTMPNPFLKLFLALSLLQHAAAFAPRYSSLSRPQTCLAYNNDKGNYPNSDQGGGWQVLNQRLHQIRLDVLEKELQMPPNPRLSAVEFVQQLLQHVLHNEDPLPESGFRLLLRTATDEWKRALYDSVGAPLTASEDVVASALGEAMGRPDNQYALLVGGQADDDDDSSDKHHHYQPAIVQTYIPTFPSEPLDYYDGTAWVECRLRDPADNSLLVSTGWELRRNQEGAWMVARMDWQDFRDKFRPGVGREEWMRVCY